MIMKPGAVAIDLSKFNLRNVRARIREARGPNVPFGYWTMDIAARVDDRDSGREVPLQTQVYLGRLDSLPAKAIADIIRFKLIHLLTHELDECLAIRIQGEEFRRDPHAEEK